MKTKEQILEWLDKQPWKDEFYEESFINRIGAGASYNVNFICVPFDWAKTKSGTSVWGIRDTEFRKWYNSNDKPISWKEYCEQNPIKDGEGYINRFSRFSKLDAQERYANTDANVMSEDLCKAFIAYMELIQLRNAWVKDSDENLYRIVWSPREGFWCFYGGWNGLSFPTKAMADEFIETFKDLLEVAKPLI